MKIFIICTKRHAKCDKVKEETMDGECSTYRDKRNAYRVLVGKPEREAPFENLGLGRR